MKVDQCKNRKNYIPKSILSIFRRHEKLQNGLPYLFFFKSSSHPLFIVDLSLYGLLIYMFVVFDKNVKLELILGQYYVKLCSDSQTYQMSVHGKLRFRPK